MEDWDSIWVTLSEDAPANNVGDHQIAGTFGDPPMPKKKLPTHFFTRAFPVSEDVFDKIKSKKPGEDWSKHLSESVSGSKILQYNQTLPDSTPLVLTHPKSGERLYLGVNRSGGGKKVINQVQP